MSPLTLKVIFKGPLLWGIRFTIFSNNNICLYLERTPFFTSFVSLESGMRNCEKISEKSENAFNVDDV